MGGMSVPGKEGIRAGTAIKGGVAEAALLPFSLPQQKDPPERLSRGKSSAAMAQGERVAQQSPKEKPSGTFHALMGALLAPAAVSASLNRVSPSHVLSARGTGSDRSTTLAAVSSGSHAPQDLVDAAPRALDNHSLPVVRAVSTGEADRTILRAGPTASSLVPGDAEVAHGSAPEPSVDLPSEAIPPAATDDLHVRPHTSTIQTSPPIPVRTETQTTDPVGNPRASVHSDRVTDSAEALPSTRSTEAGSPTANQPPSETSTPSVHGTREIRTTAVRSSPRSPLDLQTSKRAVSDSNTPFVPADTRGSTMQSGGSVSVPVGVSTGTPATSAPVAMPEVAPAPPHPTPPAQASANAVVVHVDPPGVGPVTVSLSVRGAEVSARLTTANAAFGTVLRSGGPVVASALETHGLVLGRWSVGGEGAGATGGGQGGAQSQTSQNTPFSTPERRGEGWRPPPQGGVRLQPPVSGNEAGHIDQWL